MPAAGVPINPYCADFPRFPTKFGAKEAALFPSSVRVHAVARPASHRYV